MGIGPRGGRALRSIGHRWDRGSRRVRHALLHGLHQRILSGPFGRGHRQHARAQTLAQRQARARPVDRCGRPRLIYIVFIIPVSLALEFGWVVGTVLLVQMFRGGYQLSLGGQERIGERGIIGGILIFGPMMLGIAAARLLGFFHGRFPGFTQENDLLSIVLPPSSSSSSPGRLHPPGISGGGSLGAGSAPRPEPRSAPSESDSSGAERSWPRSSAIQISKCGVPP